MFTAIVDQLDLRDEQSLIFGNSPWEEMLYMALLRIFGIKSEAVLATMTAEDKQGIVKRFQEPLER